MRGDLLTEPGRFAPLPANHAGVGMPCLLCGSPLEADDVPALIEWGDDGDELVVAGTGRAYTTEARLAHELCALSPERRGR